MKTQKRLILSQTDDKLRRYTRIENIVTPQSGWLRAIREATGMPLHKLAKKLHVSPSNVLQREKREADGTVTLRILKETAEAMDLKFVYGFVPKDGSLQKLVRRKATETARKIVSRTSQSMELEKQAVSSARLARAIKEKILELELEMPTYLWD